MKCTRDNLLLYAITDRLWLNGRSLEDVVEESLEGGATFLQLREKDLDKEHFLMEAKKLKDLCHRHHVPFVINDNVEIAVVADADGVHLGQHDMNPLEARKILGPEKIIGVSAHNVDEAILAEKNGADYLGTGSVFTTTTKNNAGHISFDTVKQITEAVSIPVIAIGGITEENVPELKGLGLCGIAVVSAIYAQKDIRKSTEKLKKTVENMVRI